MIEKNTAIEITWGREVDEKRLFALAETFRKRCDIPPQAMIDILLADDKTLAELNLEYRDTGGPTDVLAFEIGKDETDSDEHWILGQIVISCDRAAEQARERGITLDEELARLAVHGLLHLAGFDHDSDAAGVEMDGISDEILEKVLSEEAG